MIVNNTNVGEGLDSKEDKPLKKDLENDIRNISNTKLFNPGKTSGIDVSVWYITRPDTRAEKNVITLASIDDVVKYAIGGEDCMPFIVKEHNGNLNTPWVYAYLDEKFTRQIVVSLKERPLDSEFWEPFNDAQNIVVPLPMYDSPAVSYVTVKKDLREDESGLRARLQTSTKKLSVETGRFKKLKTLKKTQDAEIELLQRKTRTDALTGMNSRGAYEEDKIKHVKYAAEHPTYVITTDVMKFKDFNDSYGHQVGDMVLIEIGGALRASLLKGTDEVYRSGGDEFIAVIRADNEEGAKFVADRMRKSVDSIRIKNPYYNDSAVDEHGRKLFELEDQFIKVRINIGYAKIVSPDPLLLRGKSEEFYKKTFDEAIAFADDATYDDKNNTIAPSKDTHSHTKRYRRTLNNDQPQ